MAFYCTTMLSMALELAAHSPEYEDVASKFFEHFVAIADAMNTLGGTGLWDEADGFYYDQLHIDGRLAPAARAFDRRTDSAVRRRSARRPADRPASRLQETDGMVPQASARSGAATFRTASINRTERTKDGTSTARRLLAIPSRERLERVLRYVLDENEFLSPYGMRSVSRVHKDHPYVLRADGQDHCVDYEPGESTSGMFGGNSNWRGPIWMPINFLLIEALERYHHFYGDELKVECPVGSGRKLTLKQVAQEIASRLVRIFLPDETGRRPCHGDERLFVDDPQLGAYPLFYEYFHGDTGRGCGASHQTGWTAGAPALARCRLPAPKSRRRCDPTIRLREAAESLGAQPDGAPPRATHSGEQLVDDFRVRDDEVGQRVVAALVGIGQLLVVEAQARRAAWRAGRARGRRRSRTGSRTRRSRRGRSPA